MIRDSGLKSRKHEVITICWKYLLSLGHKSGYGGAATKADLDNHSNQKNSNNPKYQGKK
jgi:hypothetical protein